MKVKLSDIKPINNMKTIELDGSHYCSICEEKFETDQLYCEHACITGYTPVDNEHLGEEFKAISESAIERGNERK